MSKSNFTGLNELKVKLKKNTNLSAVDNIVNKNGAELQQNAMKFAPVRTGFLKRDINIAIQDSGKTAKITSDAYYAPYQEFGTRFMAGTPHVGPAFKIQKPIFISDLNKIMK